MNKLGFYIENTLVPGLRDAIREVKPPAILIHAQDRGLMRDIRATLSPNSYVVGRMFVDQQQQAAWLDSADPAAAGRGYAEQILAYDFGLATEKVNDRLLVDAWMTLNEALPGPLTFPDGQPDAIWKRRAAAYDDFQIAFRERLRRGGSRQWLSTSPPATSRGRKITWTGSPRRWRPISFSAFTSTAGRVCSRRRSMPALRCSIGRA